MALLSVNILFLLLGAVSAIPLSADGPRLPDRHDLSVRSSPSSLDGKIVTRFIPLSGPSLTLPSQNSSNDLNLTIAPPNNSSFPDNQVGGTLWWRYYEDGYTVKITHWEGHVDQGAKGNLQRYLANGKTHLKKLMRDRGLPESTQWTTAISDGRFVYTDSSVRQTMIISQDTRTFSMPTLTYGDMRIILRGFVEWGNDISSAYNVIDTAEVELFKQSDGGGRRASGTLDDEPPPAS